MKRVLKWIFIVLGALLLLGVIAAPLLLGFVYRERMPMMYSLHGMRGYNMLWFLGGWGWMLGRLIAPLLVGGLLLWAAYSLGRNARQPRVTQAASPAQPMQGVIVAPAAYAPPAPAVEQPAVEQPVPPETADDAPGVIRSCANCGRQAQPDWVACPYCGEKL